MNKCEIAVMLDLAALPYKLQKYVLDKYSTPEEIFKDEKEIVKGVGQELYDKLKNAISIRNYEKSKLLLNKYDIKAVCYLDENYPRQLLNIEYFPLVLYYKGDLNLVNEKLIAVVGTRRPTAYGREITRDFSKQLCKANMVTVSGLAYGLDMEVAVASLGVKGKTIAVLGGGLDKIYPSQNSSLAEKIVKSGGLLLSLYAPQKRPTKYSFVDRNRVISGLSLGTVIIEAGKSSGTLNTANHTIEQGKELFVVPGNIYSPSFFGSNSLIDQLPQTFTISVDHILDVLKIEKPKESKNEEKIDKNNQEEADIEKKIVNLLYEQDLDFDTLKEKTGLDSKSLIRRLTTMEINALIKKLPNNFYSLYVRR